MNNTERGIRAWAAANTASDVEGILGLYADDIVIEDIDQDITWRGKAELAEMLGPWFASFAKIELQLVRCLAADRFGVAEWTADTVLRGVVPGMGAIPSDREIPATIHGLNLFEFAADGRIERVTGSWNKAAFTQQLWGSITP
jgi:steroid delta-isomerase-like uncharacterized protein